MTSFTCDEVEARLDLSAAGECDLAEQSAIDAHVQHCPRCAEALNEARSALELLDLHWQAPAALERLHARLEDARQEEQAAPDGAVISFRPVRLVSFVRRFAAVAALLLTPSGIGLLFPSASAPSLPELAVAVVPAERQALVPAVPSRGGPEKVVPMAEASKTLLMPLAWAAKDHRGKRIPAPEVNLDFRIDNQTVVPLYLEVGGEDFALLLDLQGPGVREEVLPVQPQPAHSEVVAPGGHHTIPISRLESRWRDRVRYSSWTRPGEYTLTVRVRLRVREGDGLTEVRMLTAPTRTIEVLGPP
jgi:hypothetical protein